MSVKLQHIDTLNDQRKLDLQGISVQFSSLLKLVKDHQDQFEDNNSLLNKRLAEYSKQGDYRLTTNQYISSTLQWNYWLTGYLAGNFSQTYDLSLPSVQTFLPNTLTSPNSFTPAFKISRNRAHVSVVIGKKKILLNFPRKKSRDSDDTFSLLWTSKHIFYCIQIITIKKFTICRDPDSKATVPKLLGDNTPERPW